MEPMENYLEEERRKMIASRVKKIRNFYIHLFIYAIGVAVYLLKTYTDAPFNFPPLQYINWFVMAIWTFIIVVDAIGLFMSEIIFGKKWEQRQVRKRMESKSKKQIWK